MKIKVKFGESGDWLPATWEGDRFLDPKRLIIQTPDFVRCDLTGVAFHAAMTEFFARHPYLLKKNYDPLANFEDFLAEDDGA